MEIISGVAYISLGVQGNQLAFDSFFFVTGFQVAFVQGFKCSSVVRGTEVAFGKPVHHAILSRLSLPLSLSLSLVASVHGTAFFSTAAPSL